MPTVMQWVKHLESKVEKQRLYATPYERRYNNQHVLPFIAREYKEVYGTGADNLLTELTAPRTGTAAIGIDALVERLTVDGATSDNSEAAKIVQEAWDDNDLPVMHREAHREALIKSMSFGQVLRSDDGRAIVGIEAADQMAVHRQSSPPYDVDAAWKASVDEWTGDRTSHLWLPGRNIELVEDKSENRDPEGSGLFSRWRVKDGGDKSSGLTGVPVVQFARQNRLLIDPVSEIEPIATLVDIVDLIEGLMVFAGHFGAVPIRYGTGLEVPRDPKDQTKPLLGPDGKPAIGFNPRADHMWFGGKDAKFGQLEPAGLASFVEWANHASSRVRAKTSIASTYYSLDLKSHMSAELLKTDEAPMVRRVNGMGRDGSFNSSWRRLQQMILTVERPANRSRVRPRWADPETRVESQATDSFQKAVASGLGVRVAAEEYLGWSPELVEKAVSEAENAARKLAQDSLILDPYLAA